ncbi:DUF2570 family protein [Serratia odorifera]|uniref:Phage lysis regulatory protein, LysB family n=2 Tax=Serratia odorifera TaxID=618 RepID=D4E386_SEROD|nr:DUF2570 family protein [Serratia odorifera]EFE95662.1 hypothetical protein HMPREF0758_2636 [Serratia odorifera DSM 4582]MBJ2066128.1 DUF2570 family protein [Serratia odorifera]PNK90385.1 DUF2570 domain-containing protein [Serratia odorifera]RII71379.1 DUF2570 domain-containing protein [Serratia odorifera]VDZ59778.1 phage lysis regulatory protein, LysB family [Serratia odorifera]
MSGRWQKLLPGALLTLLLLAAGLWGYGSLQSHRLALAQQQLADQRKTVAQQALLITTLQTQEAQNRALMARLQQQEQQLRQQSDNHRRKYREAIKHDACAGRAMPDAVLELLRPANAAIPGGAVAP